MRITSRSVIATMELSDLTRIAEQHHHDITSLSLAESSAFTVEDSIGHCHIALSDKLTGAAEVVALAHELGHCEYGGFYNYHSPYELRSRTEHRADRWAILRMIPLPELQEEIRDNDNLWDLADHFNVTPEFMQKALRFYIDQLGEELCPERRSNI